MSVARIQRDWEAQTVAIFASGPSMRAEDAEALRGTCRTIAVNNQSFDCAPWADIIWSSDFKWWKQYWPQVQSLPGRKLTVLRGQVHPGVEYLEFSIKDYDERPTHISCGGNSGYAALCLAVKLGAARVLLYGYDAREVGGRLRRFDYPPRLNSRGRFSIWCQNFEKLAPILKSKGVDVVNCTPASALHCFRFAGIGEARCA